MVKFFGLQCRMKQNDVEGCQIWGFVPGGLDRWLVPSLCWLLMGGKVLNDVKSLSTSFAVNYRLCMPKPELVPLILICLV